MNNALAQRQLQRKFFKFRLSKTFVAKDQQRGSATVEFGLLLPLLLFLIFGILEFGLALYNKSVITTASREGARLGIVLRVPSVSQTEIRSRVLTSTDNALVSLGATSLVTVDFPPQADANNLAVRVNYTFRGLAVGSLLTALGSPLVLSSTTVMVKE